MPLLLKLCLLGLLTGCLVQASEVSYPSDPEGQIKRWDGLLALKPTNYDLAVVDMFEGAIPYQSRAATAALEDVRFLYRKPDDKAYRQEMDMVSGWASGEVGFEKSLFLHTSFQLPGRQHYHLRPERPVRIDGQLIRASIWIHSSASRHAFSLVFKSVRGREVRVPVTYLNYHGWKRHDVALPVELYHRSQRADNRYAHYFTGFLIESHPLADSGDFAIMLDNFLVLSDIKEFAYPGYEQADVWE